MHKQLFFILTLVFLSFGINANVDNDTLKAKVKTDSAFTLAPDDPILSIIDSAVAHHYFLSLGFDGHFDSLYSKTDTFYTIDSATVTERMQIINQKNTVYISI